MPSPGPHPFSVRLYLMRRRVWLLCVALVLGLGGCATGAPSGLSSAGASTTPSSLPGCPASLDVNNADNGKTVCVTRGGAVTVSLLGSPGQDWAPLQVSPAQVLTAVPISRSGPADMTVSAYTAAAAGMADLTSSRSACPPPAPGSVACHATQAFRVTVTVR
jgi:hypothetical protein